MPSLSCKVRSKQFSVNPNLASSDPVQELISRKVLELKQDLAQGIQKAFKEIVDATSGDSSACGLKPITFIRQVSALSCLPELLNDANFPDDVKTRAKLFLQNHLRDKTGIEMVRRNAAEFLQQRDDCPADYNDVILVPGISASVKIIMKILKLNSADGLEIGVMSAVPHFLPLSTSLVEHGLKMVEYPLVEERHWSIVKDDLEKSVSHGKTVCIPKAIIVVNPGHPTGHILSRTNMEDIIQFAEREKLLIIAVEIYQGAVHDEYKMFSFKKVLSEMTTPVSNAELVSIMLYSGDFTIEPGLQNGFMELYNINEQVKDYIKRSMSTCDSSPMCSQVALDCIVNPPKQQDPSYFQFCRDTETFQTYAGVLAKIIYNNISRIPGLSCSPVQAGYSVFIKTAIPQKAVDIAKSMNLCPSTFYVLEMLQHSGIVTESGEKYGQNPGSYYFIMTFLMPEDKLRKVLTKIKEFHKFFFERYQQFNIYN